MVTKVGLAIALVLVGCGGAQSGGEAEHEGPVDQACLDELVASAPKLRPFGDAPPLPVAKEIEPKELTALLASGDRVILPSDTTKNQIARVARRYGLATVRVAGVFQVCINTMGVPQIERLYSTCFPRYDEKIRQGVLTYRYRPYTDENGPAPACSSMTFMYEQR